MKQFHVTKASRDKYQFDQVLFSKNGNVIFANFQASRDFAHKINQLRTDPDDPTTYASPADINALGMIDEIFHHIMDEYYKTHGRSIQSALARYLIENLGREEATKTLIEFNQQFPPVEVYQEELSVSEYLKQSDHGINNYDVTVEELLMTWLTNINPAAKNYREIFDDRELYADSAYASLVDLIQRFFKTQPTFGPENQDLVTMLRTPALVEPNSLTGQLEFIRKKWATFLGDFLLRLLGSLDLLAEEAKAKAMFFGAGPDFSNAETFVPDYSLDAWGAQLNEIENFSPDSDWMPKVVMMAKNVFVWLNQLSRQYKRQIDRLDQIPDESLDQLAHWGFTGLWLIGLWERSGASREIKQMCGNPDAVSSAYSLAKYQIAERLGGEQSYYNLSQRCGARGIRLASDMVPNHMGIDSDWVYEHPEWFIRSDSSPFPAYTFNGPDLSKRPGVSINLEDHYYSRSDAAVVFKRYDHNSGKTDYIYHGNDGTSMPWNDTAQLDYLNPVVREAVIQTILSVARKFPIIRFDAAMTLTKKHYQRLWFPQPGSGGDIPSRADHAMTKEAFDQAMPEEFWREVVDRVAEEVPDTLLLAEAFWLMEGYFVRTLGMHRVYNSASMHMLRNEENEKYRLLIKNTLVYDPQILKRYVNFMNNPDEKTAVEQFGKGDKYFGICTLLSTMPGLPMFGHGQIEGYSEKYGMEYYRPYWDETPDQALINHHASTIFPILHRRRIFAEVDNFRLYDFYTTDGHVDENVFAYSNYSNGQAALVVYNNRFGDTSGWIRQSVPFLVKDGGEGHLEQSDLADAMRLYGGSDDFVVFRDAISKLFFIRSINDIRSNGLFFQLSAYSHQVLVDFRVVNGAQYATLNRVLNGHGISNLETTLEEISLTPLLNPLKSIINASNLKILRDLGQELEPNLELLKENLKNLKHAGITEQNAFELDQAATEAEKLLLAIIDPDSIGSKTGLSAMQTIQSKLEFVKEELDADPRKQFVLMIWAFLSNLAGPGSDPDAAKLNREISERKPVQNLVISTLKELGYSDYEAWKNTQAVQSMLNHLSMIEADSLSKDLVETWLTDAKIQEYLEINSYNNIRWFNKERFGDLIWYQIAGRFFKLALEEEVEITVMLENLLFQDELFEEIVAAEDDSEYQIDKLLTNLEQV
ncbi:MAG: alpha-amylase family glycosyl hydrolase [Anaerolineaceae bacterium]|nr:alpha-amylase family glycosyl hydrolase [Anaerolineaceae bacterium]